MNQIKYTIFLSVLLGLTTQFFSAIAADVPTQESLEYSVSSNFDPVFIHAPSNHTNFIHEDVIAVELEIEEDISSSENNQKIILPSVLTFSLSAAAPINNIGFYSIFYTQIQAIPTSFLCILFEVFRI